MVNDVPFGYYDGPAVPAADELIRRTRAELGGHPKDEIFQVLEAGLHEAGVQPRLDALEVLARELSWKPDQD